MYELYITDQDGHKDLCWTSEGTDTLTVIIDQSMHFEMYELESVSKVAEFTHYHELLEYVGEIVFDFYTLKTKFEPNTGGWISPEGVFYPCHYYEHGLTATLIGFKRFNDPSISNYELEKRNWLHISDYGLVTSAENEPTQAQLNTLSAVMLYATERSFKDELSYHIKRFK